MKNEHISIAVDGPSGAGKSTLSRSAAKHFGIIYVDTGALYRSVGLAVMRSGIDHKNIEAVTAILAGLTVDLKYNASGEQRMYLNGEDVSEEIRNPAVSLYASEVSAMAPVREFLLEMQRSIARENNVIMDGRDIGTVVLPEASLKIYLTASIEDRAERRFKELREKGFGARYVEVMRDMKYRDKHDSEREESPLCAAADAVTLDTSGNSFAESEKIIFELISEKLSI